MTRSRDVNRKHVFQVFYDQYLFLTNETCTELAWDYSFHSSENRIEIKPAIQERSVYITHFVKSVKSTNELVPFHN